MKKIYAMLAMAMMAVAATAQGVDNVTTVTMDFNKNPWNYPLSEVTSGWAPDFKDWNTPGAILTEKDFSWPLAEGSEQKIKVTVYPVDLDEYEKISVFATYDLDDAEAAGQSVPAGKTAILYTTNGTTMRFEAPEGYKFVKMVFYNFRSSNFLVGDEYEEEFEYTYGTETFKHKLKVWTPTSPHKNAYDMQIWDGDEKKILFNYPYFSAHFVKIVISLVADGAAAIRDVKAPVLNGAKATMLDGRQVNSLQKGIYIVDGKKHVVK